MQHFTYKKHGGRLFRLWSSSLATELKPFPFTLLRTLLRRKKINSFVFKRFRTLYRKTQGMGVPISLGPLSLHWPESANSKIPALPELARYLCQRIRFQLSAVNLFWERKGRPAD